MIEWLVAGVAVVLVLLLAFVVAAAVLLTDRARGERAVKVLRMLLLGTTPAMAGVVIKLHQTGLL
jgi:hypothetical protein